MSNKEMKKDHHHEKSADYIVAIGASAGGLEAIQELFDVMPINLSAAFIIVQHLSPDYKSLMDELLRPHTQMTVQIAEEGQPLVKGNVYLIPTGKIIRVAEGCIYLSELPPDNRINTYINELFRTVSEDYGSKTIGIVLSGTGSDGSRGLDLIKDEGGLVLVQDPEEAKFDGMPNSAINFSTVDFVLRVADMPKKIERFLSYSSKVSSDSYDDDNLEDRYELMREILNFINNKTDLDFRLYKEGTISRRIAHRMSINSYDNFRSYFEYLKSSPEEVDLFKRDMLIGVTQFFRDQDVWESIKSIIIPSVVSAKLGTKHPLRAWSVGCSTGEEPYSLAMFLLEEAEKQGYSGVVKVFASDIDQGSVAFAAAGLYPASITLELDEHLLNKYFISLSDGSFQVNKLLRSTVVFATQNIIQDPPFSNMDIVCCRNTLIYLQSRAQQKAIAYFHFSLKLDGYLILGNSETAGHFSNYFEIIDINLRLYQKKSDIKIPLSSVSSDMPRRTISTKHLNAITKSNDKKFFPFTKPIPKESPLCLDEVISELLPPTMIFDDKTKLLYCYNNVSNFTVNVKTGHVNTYLSEILNEECKVKVLAAVQQVIRHLRSVLFKKSFTLNSDDELTKISWSIKAIPILDDEKLKYISVSFINEELSDIADEVIELDQLCVQRITELDNALLESQSLYVHSKEELDSVREELQSSNEELMASNEELQSTNEELQSVNEELYTVNNEHQIKIKELTSAHKDLENIIKYTKIAAVFLDKDLNIRKFTHGVTKFMNILDFDINRSIYDLKLKYNFDGFYELINKVNNFAKKETRLYEIREDFNVEISIIPCVDNEPLNGVTIIMKMDNE